MLNEISFRFIDPSFHAILRKHKMNSDQVLSSQAHYHHHESSETSVTLSSTNVDESESNNNLTEVTVAEPSDKATSKAKKEKKKKKKKKAHKVDREEESENGLTEQTTSTRKKKRRTRKADHGNHEESKPAPTLLLEQTTSTKKEEEVDDVDSEESKPAPDLLKEKKITTTKGEEGTLVVDQEESNHSSKSETTDATKKPTTHEVDQKVPKPIPNLSNLEAKGTRRSQSKHQHQLLPQHYRRPEVTEPKPSPMRYPRQVVETIDTEYKLAEKIQQASSPSQRRVSIALKLKQKSPVRSPAPSSRPLTPGSSPRSVLTSQGSTTSRNSTNSQESSNSKQPMGRTRYQDTVRRQEIGNATVTLQVRT